VSGKCRPREVGTLGPRKLIKILREKGHTRGHSCDLALGQEPYGRTPEIT
jgi:hypothetical protein